MIASLVRVWRVAVMDWAISLRSRRAVVVLVLFAAVSGLVMYGVVSGFAALEEQVVETLRLPPSETPGSVTMTLWRSKPFVRVVEHLLDNSLVFADIKGQHPLLLAYAFFLFQIVAVLTLMISSSRVADDVRSGAVRYWLIRVTRTEWSLGKFVGETLTVAVAMIVGSLVAWGVLLARLPGGDVTWLLPGLLGWALRAWVVAVFWLGLFLGVSHLVKSGGKAMMLGVLAMVLVPAWPTLLSVLIDRLSLPEAVRMLDVFSPGSAIDLLWRKSPSALFQGVVHLVALAGFYLALGAAVFRRRDI